MSVDDRKIKSLESMAHSMKLMAKSMENIMQTFVDVGRLIAQNLEEDSERKNDPNQTELFNDDEQPF